jgi:predicted amidohydrolase
MKVCVIQTKPVTGDIQKNIDSHKNFIATAIANNVELVIFPELSLTSYEPKLARQLATTPHDSRFDAFQKLSNDARIVIGAGVPIKHNSGVCISMLLFQPFKALRIYSKKYLHPDEVPYFVSGENFPCLEIANNRVAFAICYELSIPEHSETLLKTVRKCTSPA